MKPKIVAAKSLTETPTLEQCFIRENWSSKNVSVARARVKAGVTTAAHHLAGVDELYLIIRGKGLVRVGKLQPTEVVAGDIVFIPAGARQQITNISRSDLIFYCICNPIFTEKCYRDEEENH